MLHDIRMLNINSRPKGNPKYGIVVAGLDFADTGIHAACVTGVGLYGDTSKSSLQTFARPIYTQSNYIRRVAWKATLLTGYLERHDVDTIAVFGNDTPQYSVEFIEDLLGLIKLPIMLLPPPDEIQYMYDPLSPCPVPPQYLRAIGTACACHAVFAEAQERLDAGYEKPPFATQDGAAA